MHQHENRDHLIERRQAEKASGRGDDPLPDAKGEIAGITGAAADGAEHKLAEEALHETMATLKATIEASPVAVLALDLGGIVRSWNPAAQQIFGWSEEEVVGRAFPVIAIDSPDGAQGDLNRILGGEIMMDCEVRCERRNGAPIDVSISTAPLRHLDGAVTGIVAVVEDITQRKAAERRLAAEHAVARVLAEAQSLDKAAPTILQALCESIDGQAGEIWIPDDADQKLICRSNWTCNDEEAFESFTSANHSITFARGAGLPGRVWASGMTVWINDLSQDDNFPRLAAASKAGLRSGMAFPIAAGGEFYGVIEFFTRRSFEPDIATQQMMGAIGQDIAQFIRRRRAEREVLRHRGHLEQLVTDRTVQLERSHQQLRLSERMAALGTLSAGLGHDMGNLLLPIRTRIDALLGEPLPERVIEHVNAIRQCTDYLQSLTNGLRLLSLDPNDVESAGQVTDLRQWWSNVEALMKNALPRNTLLVPPDLVEMSPRISLAIAPHRLTQAVFNLIKNAGDALRGTTGGRVQVSAQMLDAPPAGCGLKSTSAPGRHWVRLSVSDNGLGMSEEVKARATEPFFTTKTRGLSTGLGLSLVHGIVTTAGGAVDIESQPGQGATIAMIIPEAPDSAGQAPSNADAEIKPQAVVTLPDQRSRMLVVQMLDSLGYAVRVDDAPAIDDQAALWVTQSTPAALETADKFVAFHPGRAVLVAGPVEPAQAKPGILSMGETLRFSRVRDMIRQVTPSIMEEMHHVGDRADSSSVRG